MEAEINLVVHCRICSSAWQRNVCIKI